MHDPATGSDARVAAALDHIHQNLGGELSVGVLARRSGLSPYHFHRLFRERVGESPMRYVRRLRLERAAQQLKWTRRPVTEVALGAGYETHEAFTRAFRARFGQPPGRFRRSAARAGPLGDLRPRLVRSPPRRIAFVRRTGPYDDVWRAFARLVSWAQPRGLVGEGKLLSVWLDDQQITAPHRTRCDAGVFVGEELEEDDEVRVRDLPGGEFAVVPYRGAYRRQGLRRAYEAVCGEWLPALGREPGGAPPFDVYVTPSYSPALEYSLTLLHVPLASTPA